METKFTSVDYDPFADEKEVYINTSEAQREIITNIYFGNDQANCAYNESVSLKLTGFFNYDVFNQAANALIERHSSLRSYFNDDGTQMIVMPHLQIEVPLIDFSMMEPQQKQNHLKELIAEEVSAPFDINKGPLFDIKVVKTEEQEHVLIITGHHLVLDGWSIGIVMQDLSKFYNAFLKNEIPDLEPANQFIEYIEDEQAFEKTEEFIKTENFWKNLFATPHAFELFNDKTRPAVRSFNADYIEVELHEEFVIALKKSGAKLGCSLVNTMIAAFEVFLHRITNNSDIVLGLPSAGQSVTGKYALVGHCVNLLPLRTNVKSEVLFSEHLKNRKKELMEVFDHQRFTFGTLLKKLIVQRDPSRIPITPACINLDMGITDGVQFEGLELNFHTNPRKFENFEMFLNISGKAKNGNLTLECTYNTDLYQRQMMQNHLNEFAELLKNLSQNFEVPISKIKLLPDYELAILDSLNTNFCKFDADKGVHELFESIVKQIPDAIAIITETEKLTYGELNDAANQLANHLLSIGIVSGNNVGVCMDRSADLIIALMAVWKTGSAYIPIDAEYPADRIKYMIETGGSSYLITTSQLNNQLNFISEHLILLDNNWQKNLPQNFNKPVVNFNSEQLAYLLFTSGSTGMPKGVMIRHNSLVNLLQAFEKLLNVTPSDKVLGITTISFDISELEIHLPLICGASLYFAKREDALNVNRIQQILIEEDITIMQATPVTWRMMKETGWNRKNDLKALCGGEAMPTDLAIYLGNCCKEVYNVYGPTEATVWATYYKINLEDFKNSEINDKPVLIGKPLQNYITYILDEQLNHVPIGIEGEIYIGGIGIADGYINRPELTSQNFITDPFDTTGLTKIYRTGDQGKYDLNGNINFIGRADFQVKIRGFRIELGEIENVLAQHEDVKLSAVVVQQDNQDKKLVAFVEAENGDIEESTKWQNDWEFIYEKAAQSIASQPIETRRLDQAVAKMLAPEEEEISAFIDEFNTVSLNRISDLTLQNVLEIGVGCGPQLLEIAHRTNNYYAIDFSKAAIEELQLKVNSHNDFADKVHLQVKHANDLNSFEDNYFDTIILNSVIQYFNSVTYLQDVILNCLRLLKPGGAIYIGDVQSKELMQTQYLMQQLKRLPADSTIEQLQKIVNSKIETNDELMVDPEYFFCLKNVSDKISHIECVARRGDLLNHETRYHYDVILYNKQVTLLDSADAGNWSTEIKDERHLAEILKNNPDDFLLVKQVPNERLLKPTQLRDLMLSSPKDDTIETISSKVDTTQNGVFVESLFHIATEQQFHIDIFWSKKTKNGYSDVSFIPESKYKLGYRAPASYYDKPLNQDYSAYANTPNLPSETNRKLIENILIELKKRLPSYMIPASINVIDKIPVMSNGKINRKQLQQITVTTIKPERVYIPPVTDSEKGLASIWERLLHVTNISTTDNFFELGGHSLIAVRMILEIEKFKGVRLPLAILFTNPTIGQLAKVLDEQTSDDLWKSITVIRKTGKRKPLFFAHGVSGNVFKYFMLGQLLDEQTPVYGLQAKGLNGKDKPFFSIPEMATYHIQEMLQIQPKGPFYVGGGSFGGYLAFEIAQQLRKMGHEVAFVGLFDLEAATKTALLNPVKKTLVELKLKSQRFASRIKTLASMNPSEQVQYFKNRFGSKAIEAERQKINDLLKKSIMEEEYGHESSSYFNSVEDACYLAMQNYTIENYDGAVVLFRAIGGYFSIDYDHDLGWAYYAKGGSEVADVPGDHTSIFEKPHVFELAKAVQHYMDKLNPC